MYKIEKYKDQISSLDAETKRRFEMVRKLSKNFSTENKTAFEIDDLLAELLDEHFKPVKSSASSSKTKAQNSSVKNSGNKEFDELFEALKKQGTQKNGISKEDINESLSEILEKRKISFYDLDGDTQKLLSSKPQVIKYDFPKIETPTFKKPNIPSFQQIIDDVVLGHNVMLIGGAGTGKTFLAENLIAKMALGREHITINCSQWTSPTEIIGGQTMDGYVEGKLIEAWKNGYILVLDELPKIDPNTAGLFNDALAKTKIPDAIIFNSRKESFKKHPSFGCIATGNIYPDKESMIYGANNKQDLSLLDRFAGCVYFIEKNPALEKEIVQNDMIWSVCNRIRSVIEEMKYEAQVSLRFMQNARDAYNLEMLRVKDKNKAGVKPDEGKTFKAVVDSFISTFTDVQQKNIREKIRYPEIFESFYYREMEKNKSVY
ncbi:MAG: AAA family ATPase [Bacteroidia bacterium]